MNQEFIAKAMVQHLACDRCGKLIPVNINPVSTCAPGAVFCEKCSKELEKEHIKERKKKMINWFVSLKWWERVILNIKQDLYYFEAKKYWSQQ